VLLDTSEGPVVVEVKNLNKKVDKEVIIKAATVAEDIGARGAIVVSARGFTRDAERMAKALRVDLIPLESLLDQIEVAEAPGDALFLTVERSRDWILAYTLKKYVRRRLLFMKLEKPVFEACTYHPLYYISMRVRVGEEPRFRDVNVIASAVYGLPLALSGGEISIVAKEISFMSPELVAAYRDLAGRTIARSEAVELIGESRWRRLYSLLKAGNLLRTVSKKPLIVRIRNVVPGIGELESAADLVVSRTARTPSKGCGVEEARVSPGSVGSFMESLLDGRVTKYTFIYAPFYRIRLESRDSSYRILWLTAWLSKPVKVNLPLEELSPK